MSESEERRSFLLCLDQIVEAYQRNPILGMPIKVHQAFSTLYKYWHLLEEEIKDLGDKPDGESTYNAHSEGWRPICTAPQNERILVVTLGYFDRKVSIGILVGDQDLFNEPGWYINWNSDKSGRMEIPPLFWMPLPKPPRAEPPHA